MHSFVRSVKYFVHLCVLCAAVILVMHLAGMLAVAPAELPALLFASWRGWVLAAAVVLLSAAYPFTGFVPADDDGEGMTFRAASPLRRLWLHFDDEVRVAQFGQWIELSGQRRTVARVAPRLEGYIAAHARTKE